MCVRARASVQRSAPTIGPAWVCCKNKVSFPLGSDQMEEEVYLDFAD